MNLIEIVQNKRRALEFYPEISDKVRISEDGITVYTHKGELKFGHEHIEGGVSISSDVDLRNQYFSKEDFDALVAVFGKKPRPYIEILGMKNEYQDKGNKYDYNFYWSNSLYENCNKQAWGLHLYEFGVQVDYFLREYEYSSVSLGKSNS